jgi:hypothetical protein
MAAVRPLLEARKAIEQQVEDLDRKVHKLARRDVQVRRFMTVPGVGPITALWLIKIGAKVISHGRSIAFQMAEVAIPRQLFQEILRLIAELRPKPLPVPA